MANTFLTTAEITYEAAATFLNSCVFATHTNRQYSDRFGQSGGKIGNTISVRKPPRYVVNRGQVAVVQDTTESFVDLTLSNQINITLNYTSADRTLSIDNFRERILKPAIVPLANTVDLDGLALYTDIYNTMGTPGTVPTALATYNLAGARLLEEGCPQDDQWYMIIDPTMQATIASNTNVMALFHPGATIAEQYRKGRIGQYGNFDWYHDQNIPVHTVGPLGGSPLINTTVATTVPGVAFVEGATSMTTDGWTASAAARLKKGDVFTVASVLAVNPVSGQTTGKLRQFVVTADVSSAADGSALVPVSPTLRTTGAFKTINAFPGDNAAITVLGAANTVTPQGVAFWKNAIVMGFADLEQPKSGEYERIVDPDSGIAMRVWEASDILNDLHITRIDMLYGFKWVYPEMAVRIAS